MAGLLSRRDIVSGWLAATSAGAASAAIGLNPAQAQSLPATPACGADSHATIAQTEGPFYRPTTPQRRNFRNDAPGDDFTLIGFVLDRQCRPVPSALIDLWHADASGAYDNRGYKLRGHQFSDAQGRYVFETITPGLYVGRTRHFHVKVQRAGGRILTTQLYFPDEPGNRRDGIFDRRLLMKVESASDGKVGRFDFVLAG